MACLAGMLAGDGYMVKCWSLEGMPDAGRPGEATEARRIVLGAPLIRNGSINGTNLAPKELFQRLRPDTPVYAGAVRSEELALAQAWGLRLTDYLADEALAVKNAAATAEGAVMLAMEHTRVTLRGAACLVLGFGRIGKLLARTLAALGAKVTVGARKSGDLAWIETLGYAPLHTQRLAGRLGGFRAVFNTVPDMVLGEELLRELPPDCTLIELASKAGVDAQAAGRLGLCIIGAPGLPGKTAPETAAQAIKETLCRLWEEEE
ncbi:MAG: dipicolinate synthase [Oscillospiraceae bacterium]|nr:dipicolinate synthase [Oscillospiraceae bacterium]